MTKKLITKSGAAPKVREGLLDKLGKRKKLSKKIWLNLNENLEQEKLSKLEEPNKYGYSQVLELPTTDKDLIQLVEELGIEKSSANKDELDIITVE